ncbi:PAS domain S-box protein [Asticcacaulis sp. AND118]|uniref:PAS domain S-box protein n=1 Tax=Asticcacaulis sp. AND118 TaxID=2840468 RepID=UPI001D000078|nr:PAS domain S-box protein [Asticcacaulis sp. AND118]UDF05320.1 PAS domain S-box protein [Asticcacaulis sp. AND118]
MARNETADETLALKARLGAIVESSDEAIIGKTLEGIITSWNQSAEAIFGYTASEAIGRNITLIIPTERLAEEELILSKIRAGERVDHFETVRRRKDGSFIDLSVTVSPICDETGRITGASKVARDITAVKQADRVSAYLAAIVDNSDDAVVSKDLNSIITSWNRGAERIFGFTAQEAVGQPVTLIIPTELRPQEDVIIAKVRRGERVDHFVTERMHKSGRIVNVSISVSPIRDSQGVIIGASKIARDVTNETRAIKHRNALSKLTDEIRDLEDPDEIAHTAARLLGETLGVSRAGYGIIDTIDETITIERDWNAPGIKSLAGVLHFRDYGSYIEDLRKGDTVVFADAEIDPRTRENAAALKAISAQSVVNMPVTERGQFVALLYLNHAEARPWPEDEIGFIKEVAERTRTATERARVTTELRHREAELRELNEQLERRIAQALAEKKLLADILQSTDAFVQVVDLNFNWLAINAASAAEFTRIFGVRPQVGDNMLEALRHLPQEQNAVRELWSRALKGEAFTQVADFGRPDLDRRYYEMKFNPLRDETGELIGAYQFVFDVTERVHDQHRLQEAEEQLRQAQKMEAVGQLTGGVAHDFNNMLAVVSGSLELLDRRTGEDNPRAKQLISAAIEASRRAATLTQRLLAFSRQQPLRPEVLDLIKVVSGMSELFRHSLGGDIQLETVFAGGLWRVHADQNQLENVLLNLAVNARDAMPEGGRLTIETQNVDLDRRYAARELGVAPGQYVMIAVSDTGAGMPPDIMAKAFDPFFTTKEVGKGTGLGLSQVYGFIKQSGGHIRLYSEPRQGTTVKIYLPRFTGAVEEPLSEQMSDDLPKADQAQVILVVDDEDLVRQFSVGALTDLGYRVLEAGSAQAALTILIERPDIDLMLTDIVMPEMNGRKLADMAKERRPDLPVIYTTGYTRNAVIHNGVLDADVELIGKPFTLEELASRVREVLEKSERS